MITKQIWTQRQRPEFRRMADKFKRANRRTRAAVYAKVGLRGVRVS